MSIFKIFKERGDICSKKQTKFIGISFRKFNLRLHTRIEKNYYLCTGKIEREKMFRSCWLKSLNRWVNVIGSKEEGERRESDLNRMWCVSSRSFSFSFFFSKLASKETQFLVRSYRQQVFIPRGKLNGRVINLPCLINRGSEGNIIIGELILSLSDGKTVFDN